VGARAPTTPTHKLLTQSPTADVEVLEAAIGQFKPDRDSANESQIACFELARDAELHVNIRQKFAVKPVTGWAGPGRVPAGFVHTRTFSTAQRGEMLRQIRNMVCAPTLNASHAARAAQTLRHHAGEPRSRKNPVRFTSTEFQSLNQAQKACELAASCGSYGESLARCNSGGCPSSC
jgi:hypothetical protein